LNPVIISPKTIKSEAIEFRDAKKPFVVEKSPIKAKANVGKLIKGDKNTPSSEVFQENTGESPERMFWKK
jgi:hypothetical protein